MKPFTSIAMLLITQSAFTAGISVDPTTGIDMGNNKITDLAAPVLPDDATTKAYMDNAAAPVAVEVGDMQYRDGSAWVLVPAPSGGKNTLVFCDGQPRWGRNYQIGDTGPVGSKVFYVDDTGCHGLEAAPADHSSTVKWGCYGIQITGTGTAVGTGAQNTADIFTGCRTSGIAADIAVNYELNGYADWFLPSKISSYLPSLRIASFSTEFLDYCQQPAILKQNAINIYYVSQYIILVTVREQNGYEPL